MLTPFLRGLVTIVARREIPAIMIPKLSLRRLFRWFPADGRNWHRPGAAFALANYPSIRRFSENQFAFFPCHAPSLRRSSASARGWEIQIEILPSRDRSTV